MSEILFPAGRHLRIAAALDAALEALKLADRELVASQDDPARWRWVALGLVSALQAGLIAALSGYETAAEDDLFMPGQPDKVAPLGFLLRRARSGECLNPPERPDLTVGETARLEALSGLRNAAVHGLDFRLPTDAGALARTAVDLAAHLLVRHPAFDQKPYGVPLALIRDVLARLQAALDAPHRG